MQLNSCIKVVACIESIFLYFSEGISVLDYSSSSRRKWLMTGIVFILFAVLEAIGIDDASVKGDLRKHHATISLSGGNKNPVMIFHIGGSITSCPVTRCRYDGWRSDLGRAGEVYIDENGNVSRLEVDGVSRFDEKELNARSFRSVAFSLFLALVGSLMCARAWFLFMKSR